MSSEKEARMEAPPEQQPSVDVATEQVAGGNVAAENVAAKSGDLQDEPTVEVSNAEGGSQEADGPVPEDETAADSGTTDSPQIEAVESHATVEETGVSEEVMDTETETHEENSVPVAQTDEPDENSDKVDKGADEEINAPKGDDVEKVTENVAESENASDPDNTVENSTNDQTSEEKTVSDHDPQSETATPAAEDVSENVESSKTDQQSQDEAMEASDSGNKTDNNDDVVMLDGDEPSEGIQISSVSGAPNDSEDQPEDTSEKKGATNEDETKETPESNDGLQICSVASLASDEKSEESSAKENSENGGLKIASVMSESPEKSEKSKDAATGTDNKKDDDVVQIDDDEEEKKDEDCDESKKKPVLKLASFADMGTNGLADVPNENPEEKKSGACCQCSKEIVGFKSSIVWETMQFCNVDCLDQYQNKMNECSTCKKSVQIASLGKYCVRFGSDIRQFCSNTCLEEYKKGLKVCCYCQKDISGGEGFMAPIGDKGQFKDFCEQPCLDKFNARTTGKPIEPEVTACAVCKEEKPVQVQLLVPDEPVIKLCSTPCLGAYTFANGITSEKCDLCKKEVSDKIDKKYKIYYHGRSNKFCSVACQNVFVMQSREIVPCSWCKVRKYNFDMVEKYFTKEKPEHFCSLNCFKSYSTKIANNAAATSAASSPGLVIQSVSSLAGAGQPGPRPDTLPTQPLPPNQLPSSGSPQQQQKQTQPAPPPKVITKTVMETVVQAPPTVEMKNKQVSAKPFMATKGVSCRPHPCHKACQTDLPATPTLVPIMVPIYMPVPMQMYQQPYPVPVPIPMPIPVPVFIPTTRNSTRGIQKALKKIKAKMPEDPFEAELLALAGAVAGTGVEANDLDSDDSLPVDDKLNDIDEVVSASLGVETAAKRSSRSSVEGSVSTLDLEREISSTNVMPKALPNVTPDAVTPTPTPTSAFHQNRNSTSKSSSSYNQQKRKHSSRADDSDGDDYKPATNFRQRQKRSRQSHRSSAAAAAAATISNNETSAAIASIAQEPREKPDAKHHLKFTYGVNAWRAWVVGKNAELEKARQQGKYMKNFETDILKLRADELSYTLCMFVKEVKKPNGDTYASDSILYLALGIQEYLFENGRIDNIFMDAYYEGFTTAMHDVVKDFKLPVNELGYFVTRIEEEHLWEAKQLGAHSPQVLLNSLVYFNTKYFMLKSLDDHAKLSFTHIMKHYKKGGQATPAPRNAPTDPNDKRTILLRYYPPNEKNYGGRDRKCYEQHESTENPMRCPVKLFEFYLSKCPENLRASKDLFYLQPERSCVPDSPVWYTNAPLNRHSLDKMLQRILMVREVQEHMLADLQSRS